MRVSLRPRGLWSRTLAAVTATALAATGLLAVAVGTAPTASAAAPLRCDQNTLYATDSAGTLAAITISTGQATTITDLSPADNGVGVSPNGIDAYGFLNGGRSITRYDTLTGTSTTYPNIEAANTTVIRGAVNPATGLYYYGGSGASAALGAFDTTTGTPIGRVGTITGLNTSNGDFAFSTRGLLFVVAGNVVVRVDQEAVPTTAGNVTLSTSLVATLPPGTNSPGIAFSTDGYLYVSNGSTIMKLDPASGELLDTFAISGDFTPTDLASCNYPNTISVEKDVVERVHDGDQFGLSVTGGDIASGNTATTAGTATGVQPQKAGAALAIPGRVYTVTETAAGTTSLANYASTYRCVNVNTGDELAAGDGTVATLVFPAATTADGTDVVCTFTNAPRKADLTLRTALAGPRNADHDQFTAAVRATGASGPVLSTTAGATTDGTGATVEPGSGTTGATTVVADRTYYLTQELAAGSSSALAQYSGTVTCVDGAGLQTGLPVGQPFTGALALTPVPGAAITCTVTYDTVHATLQLASTLASPRYLDGDQFTVAVRAGSPDGPLVSSLANAATTGDAATVTPGTGVTGVVTAAPGTTYYLTQSVGANDARYRAVLSCTDANGYTADLPTAEPFDQVRALTPAAGSAVSCVVVNAQAPASFSVTKANPASLTVGAASTYRLDVTNVGGLSGQTRLVDRLPAGLEYTASSGTGWSCTASGTPAAGELVTCDSPTIAGGTTSTLLLTVTPLPGTAGQSVRNSAAVDADGGTDPADPAGCAADGTDPACAVAPAPVVVDDGIALALTKTGPSALTVNVPAQYVLTVTNTGTGPAAGATVRDVLPAGLTYTAAAGADCVASGQDVTCTVTGPIAPAGGTASFTLTVTPTAALAGGSVINTAAVDADGGTAPDDPTTCDPSGDAACASTPPVPVTTALLHLTKTVQPVAPATVPVGVGDRLRYSFTVTNDSTTTVTSVAVVDPSLGDVSCPVTVLAPGASVVCSGPDHRVTQEDVDAGGVVNTATASAVLDGCATDCALTAPASTVTAPTLSTGALLAEKSGVLADTNRDGRANAGETIAYTVRVTNTGTVTLTGLRVLDPLVDMACSVDVLSPGESTDCTARYVVTTDDERAGTVHNVARAEARSALGQVVTSPSSSHVVSAGPAPAEAPVPVAAVEALATTGAPADTLLAQLLLLLGTGVVLLVVSRRARQR